MGLDILEIAVIGGIILAFIVLGPKKIPELARSIGLAKKEFKEATEK
jgi:TatA/E family protein of Tat protein translocase